MSVWYQQKEKNGRTSLIGFDISYELIIIFIGLVVAIFTPVIITGQYQTGSLIVAVGFVLFFISKVSLFRRGIWRSWGPAQMSNSYKALYVTVYVFRLFGIGLVLLIYKIHG